jgi:tripartite-type tricarboxylate transporter receptor subunit TctC
VLARYPNVLVATPSFPAQNVKDVLALAKQKPGAVAFASSGNGSAQHLAGVLFEQRAGVDLLHVPYKGGGPAMTDVIAGQVPLFFANVASSLQHIKAGKLKPLAVTSRARLEVLPNVPTVAESGYPNFQASTWFGLAVPAQTPPEAVTRLQAAAAQVLRDPQFRSTFSALGLVVQPPRTQAEIDRYVEADREHWGKVIRANNISLD